MEVLDPQTEVAWETGAGEVYESMVIISGAAKRAASGPGLVPVLSVDAAGMKGIGDRFPEGTFSGRPYGGAPRRTGPAGLVLTGSY